MPKIGIHIYVTIKPCVWKSDFSFLSLRVKFPGFLLFKQRTRGWILRKRNTVRDNKVVTFILPKLAFILPKLAFKMQKGAFKMPNRSIQNAKKEHSKMPNSVI